MPGISTKKGQVIPFIQDGGFFYKKGIEAYQSKQVERATLYFERAIQLEPEEPVFMCQLAIILSEEGDYETSNQWLMKIKNVVDPSMSECYFFLANNMAHIGEFEEAKVNLETYLSIDEDGEFVEDAEMLLTMVDEQLHQQEQSNDSENPIPVNSHGNNHYIGLLNRGEFAQAEKETRKQIAKQPKQWDLYVYLAEALMYQNETEEAEKILKDLLLKEEPNFLAQCQMTVLLHQKNDPQASVWVENIVNLRPMNDWSCYFLARSLFFVGEYRTAYTWYDKLLNGFSFQKRPDFFHQMAILAWHCGDTDVSRRIWKNIQKEDPTKQGFVEQLLLSLDREIRPPRDKNQFLYK